MVPATPPPTIEFGPYVLDPQAGELRKFGVRIRLQEKSFRLLLALAQRPGQVTSREELHKLLWPDDVYVDFESGLNTAVSKVREALSDDPDNPRFIETIPRRGYRFLVQTRVVESPSAAAPPANLPPSAAEPSATVATDDVSAPEPFGKVEAATTDRRVESSHVRRLFLVAVALVVSAVFLVVVLGLTRGRMMLRGRPPARIKIAVLPFQNLTGDSEEEFVSDGFTEEIITQLGQLNHDRIAVIARTSAMGYKGSTKTIREIASELGVEYILEGSVRKTATGLRIAAQLIRADDQTHLWAHEYDRAFEGLVQVQEQVAQAVAEEVQVNLTPVQDAAGVASTHELNPESYRSYLRGRYYLATRSGDGLTKAVASFQDAVDRDPSYAPAYAGMADAYNLLVFYGFDPGRAGIAKAKAAAQKAIEIDPNLARGHASLAYGLYMWEWKWADAEREFQTAIRLDPNYSTAHHWYAQCLAALGRTKEALAEIRTAEELDPRSLIVTTAHGYLDYFARDYSGAAAECKVALERNPNFMVAHAVLGLADEQKSDMTGAISEFERALQLSGGRPAPYLDYLGHAYAAAGKQQEAETILKELDVQLKGGKGGPAFRAATLAALGKKQEAIDALEEGYAMGDGAMIWLLVDPRYESLRADPRYARLISGFAPAH